MTLTTDLQPENMKAPMKLTFGIPMDEMKTKLIGKKSDVEPRFRKAGNTESEPCIHIIID